MSKKNASMCSTEHRSFSVSGRVRRCLLLAVVLLIGLALCGGTSSWTDSAASWKLPYRTWEGQPVASGSQDNAYPVALEQSVHHEVQIPLRSRIGKVTMVYGDPNPAFERALASHEVHAKQHGYAIHVLRAPLLDGIWSKLGYLLSVVLIELQKPPSERLEWVFWFDADTYILNPNVPIEAFLPPSNDPFFTNISYLGANDQQGLQAGTFLLRVDAWAVELLSAAIALPRYRPDLDLLYVEQTALGHLFAPKLVTPPVIGAARYFEQRRVAIPQRWMNAYVGYRGWDSTPVEDESGKPKKWKVASGVQEGDMLVHFAEGSEFKRERMTAFMDAIDSQPERWAIPFEQTGWKQKIEAFWATVKLTHGLHDDEREQLYDDSTSEA